MEYFLIRSYSGKWGPRPSLKIKVLEFKKKGSSIIKDLLPFSELLQTKIWLLSHVPLGAERGIQIAEIIQTKHEVALRVEEKGTISSNLAFPGESAFDYKMVWQATRRTAAVAGEQVSNAQYEHFIWILYEGGPRSVPISQSMCDYLETKTRELCFKKHPLEFVFMCAKVTTENSNNVSVAIRTECEGERSPKELALLLMPILIRDDVNKVAAIRTWLTTTHRMFTKALSSLELIIKKYNFQQNQSHLRKLFDCFEKVKSLDDLIVVLFPEFAAISPNQESPKDFWANYSKLHDKFSQGRPPAFDLVLRLSEEYDLLKKPTQIKDFMSHFDHLLAILGSQTNFHPILRYCSDNTHSRWYSAPETAQKWEEIASLGCKLNKLILSSTCSEFVSVFQNTSLVSFNLGTGSTMFKLDSAFHFLGLREMLIRTAFVNRRKLHLLVQATKSENIVENYLLIFDSSSTLVKCITLHDPIELRHRPAWHHNKLMANVYSGLAVYNFDPYIQSQNNHEVFRSKDRWQPENTPAKANSVAFGSQYCIYSHTEHIYLAMFGEPIKMTPTPTNVWSWDHTTQFKEITLLLNEKALRLFVIKTTNPKTESIECFSVHLENPQLKPLSQCKLDFSDQPTDGGLCLALWRSISSKNHFFVLRDYLNYRSLFTFWKCKLIKVKVNGLINHTIKIKLGTKIVALNTPNSHYSGLYLSNKSTVNNQVYTLVQYKLNRN